MPTPQVSEFQKGEPDQTMRISGTEALTLLRKWEYNTAALCVVFFGRNEGEDQFLTFSSSVRDLVVVGDGFAVVTPGEYGTLFASFQPGGDRFYYGLPSDPDLRLSGSVRFSTKMKELEAANTPLLKIDYDAGILLIHEHPDNIHHPEDDVDLGGAAER